MGCCSSIYADDHYKTKHKRRDHYVATSTQERTPKRCYIPHISSGSSSGYSSACTSPSRPSLLSRYNSSPSSIQTKVKTKNFITNPRNTPAPSENMTICDDFHDAVKIQTHQENKSFGYYSESLSTDSSVSTPPQSCRRRRQVSCSRPKSTFAAPTPNGMEMEMYMMYHQYQRIALKTSSPIFNRRDVTYDAVSAVSPTSHSYQKWANYLQNTPTCKLHAVTGIPEAIAGHFSPLSFPAFTDLEEMESAAKRYKVDTRPKKRSPILTTDL